MMKEFISKVFIPLVELNLVDEFDQGDEFHKEGEFH